MVKLIPNPTFAEEHFNSVKDIIINRIPGIIKNGAIIGGQSYSVSPSIKSFLKSIENPDELRKLICLSPENLKGIFAYFKQNTNVFITTSPDNRILYNLFVRNGYESKVFDKHKFISRFSVDTCCYCNRNYIYYLSKSNGVKPEIDHFYPKNLYPFLGLSFYNLIPSCQTCNGQACKYEKDPSTHGLVNPYLISYSDFKFTFKIKSGKVVNSISDKDSVELDFKFGLKGHIKTFKLKELYDLHKDHVAELIMKSKTEYQQTYRDYLMQYDLPGKEFLDKELNQLILGNYILESEIHKRPLAKLYQDIGRELGLI